MTTLIYTCKRCHYESVYKSAIIKHLQKQNECNAIYEDIDRSKLLEEFRKEKNKEEYIYECTICNMFFKYRSNLSRHETICLKKKKEKDSNQIKNLKSRIEYIEKKTLISFDKEGNLDVCNHTIYILHKLLPGGGFAGLCSRLQMLLETNIYVVTKIINDGLIYTMVQKEEGNLNIEHLINELDDIEIQHTSFTSFQREKPIELYELYKGRLIYKSFL